MTSFSNMTSTIFDCLTKIVYEYFYDPNIIIPDNVIDLSNYSGNESIVIPDNLYDLRDELVIMPDH